MGFPSFSLCSSPPPPPPLVNFDSPLVSNKAFTTAEDEEVEVKAEEGGVSLFDETASKDESGFLGEDELETEAEFEEETLKVTAAADDVVVVVLVLVESGEVVIAAEVVVKSVLAAVGVAAGVLFDATLAVPPPLGVFGVVGWD